MICLLNFILGHEKDFGKGLESFVTGEENRMMKMMMMLVSVLAVVAAAAG